MSERAYSLLQSLNFYSDTLGRLALTDRQDVGETAARLIRSCMNYGVSMVVLERGTDGNKVCSCRGFEASSDPPLEVGAFLLDNVLAPEVVDRQDLPAEMRQAAGQIGAGGPLLCAPLRGRDGAEERKLGILIAARPPTNGQSRIDLQALDTLGGFVSTALVSCAMHEGIDAQIKQRRRVELELRRSRDRLELITLISRGLDAESTAVDVVERIVRGLSTAFPELRAVYATLDEAQRLTHMFSSDPGDMSSVERRSLDLQAASAYVEALRADEPVIVEDVLRDSRLAAIAAELVGSGTRAVLDVPLWHAPQLVGVLRFESPAARRWSAHEVSTLLEESEFLSLALKNAHDRAERDHAREASRMLELQLFQAQKMQAIGRLAGSVAHDFNNVLMAIEGYAEELLDEFDRNDPLRPAATAIMEAAERAAGLTRQLLEFSRKRDGQAEAVDLNAVIVRIESMLGRMIGGDIELSMNLKSELPAVHVEVSRIEQILINLAVNARDAMPDGGKLKIDTQDVTLGPSRVDVVPGLADGRYALLSVSDNGRGMSPEVKERVFEPFFTTKEQGEGTGLGLATVYAVVSQSGGAINVISEPQRGTTVEVYLPECEAAPTQPVAELRHDSRSHGETLLLVEDDAVVRHLLERSLVSRGYRVLTADRGDRVLEMACEQLAEIDLLITDVVMPGMDGRELVKSLFEQSAPIPVIYISAFADNAIGEQADPGTYFLTKPFALSTLAEKVREVLNSRIELVR